MTYLSQLPKRLMLAVALACAAGTHAGEPSGGGWSDRVSDARSMDVPLASPPGAPQKSRARIAIAPLRTATRTAAVEPVASKPPAKSWWRRTPKAPRRTAFDFWSQDRLDLK